MTVENTNPIQHFTANGSTTVFSVNFAIEDKDNIKVIVNNETVPQGLYSYDSENNAVVFNAAPKKDSDVVIARLTSLERSINYQTYNNSFRPETVNYDLDRLWRVLQEDKVADAIFLARLKSEIDTRRYSDSLLQHQIDILNDVLIGVFDKASTEYLSEKLDALAQALEVEARKHSATFNKKINELSGAINTALAAGAGSAGWTASLVVDASGKTQQQVNETLKTVIDSRLWVEQFAQGDDLKVDAGGAFRRAIAYAKANNFETIWFRGNYKITSLETQKWTMPFDDGSLPTSVLNLDEHGILPPEATTQMPVHLIIPSNLSIRAENIRNCSLDFGWNVNTGAIAPTSPIAILQQCENFTGTYTPTTTGKNRYNSWVRGNFGGFTLKNAFIGILADGVRFSDDWQPMRFTDCGIAVVAAGLDSCRFERLIFEKCLSGLVAGGWWQQRSSNTYGYMPLDGDIHAIGWVDATNIGMVHYGLTPINATFINTRLNVLDQFFDTYFYKTANNTSRLSTYRSADRATAESDIIAYTGIASRAIWTAPRQRRTGLANRLNFIKVYGSTRAPIYTYEKWEIGEAFTEFVGRVDTTVGLETGNIYYTDFTDQYLSNSVPFAGVIEEAYYATADSSVDYHSPVSCPRVTSVAKPHRKIPSKIYTMGTDYKFNETNYDNAKVLTTARTVVRPTTSSTDTTYTHYNITPRLAYWSMGMSFKNSSWSQVDTDGELLFQTTAYGNTAIDPTFYGVIRLGTGSSPTEVTVPCRMNYVRERGMVRLFVFFNVTEDLLASDKSMYLQVFTKIPLHTGNDSWGIREPNFKLVSMPVTSPTVPVRATFNKNSLGMQITFWKDYAATEAFLANEFVGTGRFVFEIEYTTADPFN